MIITNSRYALVGYFITSYPTRAHGIIVIYRLMVPAPDLQCLMVILHKYVIVIVIAIIIIIIIIVSPFAKNKKGTFCKIS